MAIEWQILGKPDADNALLVTIDSGQSREQMLFDCGQNCLDELSVGSIQSIQNLFFSHFHMDHVSGFDTFFRHNYNRPSAPVQVWGPPGTVELLAHRFQGFSWNLHSDQPGKWVVREQNGDQIEGASFITAEAFGTAYPLPREALDDGRSLLKTSSYRVESLLLPHGSIPSAAYRVVEADKANIDSGALRESGLIPGPWLQALAEQSRPADESIEVGGTNQKLGDLRKQLVKKSPGDSLAFLTDFQILPGTKPWEEVTEWLRGTSVLVCECQYSEDDAALATRHGHMSAKLAGQLAADSGVNQLVLQHFSRRYERAKIDEILNSVRGVFPNTHLPKTWG